MLIRLFHSRALVRVLGVVLFRNGLHLREISRVSGVSPYETKRQLDNLSSIGVLNEAKQGNQRIFYLNEACAFLSDLKNLYLKTEGFVGKLRKSLKKLNGIEFAFIYGSVAKGDFSERSDIDLIVVGSVTEEELALNVFNVQKEINYDINYVLWTENDFLKKIGKEKSSFILNVINNKKNWLIGDEDKFAGIVNKSVNSKNKAR